MKARRNVGVLGAVLLIVGSVGLTSFLSAQYSAEAGTDAAGTLKTPRVGFHLAVVLTPSVVSIVDTTLHKQIATIPIPNAQDAPPFEVAMTRQGQYAYVGTYGSILGSIYKIDLATFAVVRDLGVSFAFLDELEMSPDDRYLVAFDVSGGGSGTLSVFDATTDTLQGQLTLCPACSHGRAQVEFSADSQKLYVADPQANQLFVVSLATLAVENTLPLPGVSGYGPPDIRRGADPLLYVHEPFEALREYDLSQNTHRDLLVGTNATGNELALVGTKLLAVGDFRWDGHPGNDFLTLVNPVSGQVTYLPTEEATGRVTYEPNSMLRMWSICPYFDNACGPNGIVEVFTPNGRVARIEASVFNEDMTFTQDGRWVYIVTGGVITRINTATFEVKGVGVTGGSRRIVMQGDNQVREGWGW